MNAGNLTLAPPPDAPRARELWLQHAAGRILMEDVRGYARARLPESLTEGERAAALTAIDDALYGLMMVVDGVTGSLRNERHSVEIGVQLRLRDADEIVATLDLPEEGDGMCMGYHGWLTGDFGDDPVVTG